MDTRSYAAGRDQARVECADQLAIALNLAPGVLSFSRLCSLAATYAMAVGGLTFAGEQLADAHRDIESAERATQERSGQ